MKINLLDRFGIIQKVIIVLAFLAMSLVWPLGAFPVSHVSTSQWDGLRMSGPSNEGGFVRQEFSPNYEQLESVSVYVVNDPESIDTMQAVLRIYDYAGTCLYEDFFQLENYELPGMVKIPVRLTVSPGTLYYYTIGGVDGDLFVAYCGDETKTAENGAFFYKEVPSGGTSIVTEYEYERPIGLKRIIAYDTVLFVVMALFIGLVLAARQTVFKKCSEKQAIKLWERAEKIVRYTVVGVTATGVVIAFIGIVMKRLFTDDFLNIVVLFSGVLIAAGYIIYGVLTCKSELEPLAEEEDCLLSKSIRFIRVLLFAITILMCCMYSNGYTDYEKGLYLRKALVFFGLFMVSFGKSRWIWNITNLVWSVLAVVIGKLHILAHSAHIEHITTATNDAWVIWVIGLLVIQFVYRVVKGEWKKLKTLSPSNLGLTLSFWIGCIVFANGRQWTWVLCIAFLLWLLLYAMTDDKEKRLEDICNGILVAFLGTVIFCLYRRPYQYFMLTRYGGIFFTATATATYYLVPAAAALTKILKAVKEKNKRNLIFGCCVYGIISAYMGFTASRTGVITMLIMLLFAIAVPVIAAKKETWKAVCRQQLKTLGVIAVSVILTFAMSFSATRMLPAVAGNPFYFWFEEPNAYMDRDTPWTGVKYTPEQYADFRLTLEMLFGRLFVLEKESDEGIANAEFVLGPMLASGDETAVMISEESVMQYSNGRIEIFQAYISQLNMWGHDTMSATNANGEPIMHAHNSYLQVAFDFGIVVGIIFVVFCFVTFLRVLLQLCKKDADSAYEYLPLLIVVAFGVASLVEWVYHVVNPLGFVFLIMLAPVMLKQKNSKALENC